MKRSYLLIVAVLFAGLSITALAQTNRNFHAQRMVLDNDSTTLYYYSVQTPQGMMNNDTLNLPLVPPGSPAAGFVYTGVNNLDLLFWDSSSVQNPQGAWMPASAATLGIVTGTGSAGAVTFWNGTHGVTADTSFKYDSTLQAFTVGFGNAANGNYSVATGYQTTATGSSATALGYLTNASGDQSLAMGQQTVASGRQSTALGYLTTASGDQSTSMGQQTTASGPLSFATGYTTTASGSYSTAMGYSTTASGTYSTALGFGTTANTSYATAMGLSTLASGPGATAMGNSTTASGGYSTAMGASTTASGSYSTAIGQGTTANNSYATAMGQGTLASGVYSTAIGQGTTASGSTSTAMGSGTQATNSYSTAIGLQTTASGFGSIAEGYLSIASGNRSVALGNGTTASGSYSTALNDGTQATGNYSLATGSQTIASGDYGFTTGNSTTASGLRSTAMGFSASTNGHQGAFVYGDNSTATVMNAGADNEFDVRAAGGVNMYTNSGLTTGVKLPANGGLSVLGASSPLSMNGSVGTSGQVLTSGGAGTTPTWTTVSSGAQTNVANTWTALQTFTAGLATNYTTVDISSATGSASYNMGNGDYSLFITGTLQPAATFYIVVLPSPAPGKICVVRNEGSTAQGRTWVDLYTDNLATNTIDGQNDYSLYFPGNGVSCITLICDGTNWHITSEF